MSGMAYKISFTALLYITVVNSVEDNQPSPKQILQSTSEAGLLPAVKYFRTPPPQYTASTPPQHGNVIIYGQPPLQPATYILQQASTVQPTQIPQQSLFIQRPAPVLQQAAPIFQQAARLLQPAPVLQYAVRIAVPQPVLIEQNLIQPEGVPQTLQYIRIVPQQAQGVGHLSPASPQLVQVTSQPQQGIQYAEDDDTNIVKYNEEVPVQVKPQGVAQTLQYKRIVPQLQQEQVVSHLSPASPQPVQVTSQQQQGIQYDEDDKNVVNYNEAVTAVPVQVKPGVAKTLQYIRIIPQLHLSPASPQPMQVTSQPQPGVQYAEEDVKYNEVVTAAPVQVKPEDFDDNPQYTYAYDVEDTNTGDSKQQSEQRIGNVVRGSYSVVDPDGYRRTVEYTVDANGFSAMVKRKPVQDGVAKSKV